MQPVPCDALNPEGELCWRPTRHQSRRCGWHRVRPLARGTALYPSTPADKTAKTLQVALDDAFAEASFNTSALYGGRPVVQWDDGPAPLAVADVLLAAIGPHGVDVGGRIVDARGHTVCCYVRRHAATTLAVALLDEIRRDPAPPRAADIELAKWAARIARAVLRDLYPQPHPDRLITVTAAAKRLAQADPPLEERSLTSWLVAHAKTSAGLGKVTSSSTHINPIEGVPSKP